MCKRAGGTWVPQGVQQALGWMGEDLQLRAGVVYEDFNGAMISAHIAIAPGHSLTREFLWTIFDYPFNQLGVRLILGVVPAANAAARRLDEHLGFTLEATLRDAHPSGDLLLYTMRREQCRWLNLKRKPPHVDRKERSAPGT